MSCLDEQYFMDWFMFDIRSYYDKLSDLHGVKIRL